MSQPKPDKAATVDRRWACGKPPEHARALELLRANMTPMDVGIIVGHSSFTIKRWAKAAGIPIRVPTLEERERRQAKADHDRVARRAHNMAITAQKRGQW